MDTYWGREVVDVDNKEEFYKICQENLNDNVKAIKTADVFLDLLTHPNKKIYSVTQDLMLVVENKDGDEYTKRVIYKLFLTPVEVFKVKFLHKDVDTEDADAVRLL